MNDRQLDMVLGYLNEGTSIDNTDYMIESINEMVEQSIYESTMITSLLEDKSDNKISLGTKIKEAIKRFINWVKTLITKLKMKMSQIGVKVMGKTIKKDIEKQKEIAKTLDKDAKVPFGKGEWLFLAYNELTVDINVEDVFGKDGKMLDNDDAKTLKDIFFETKYPTIALLLDAKLTSLITKKFKPNEDKYYRDTVSISEYIKILDRLPANVDILIKYN